jgi:hypothetical protein
MEQQFSGITSSLLSAIAYFVWCFNKATHRIIANIRCSTLRANAPYEKDYYSPSLS